MNILYIANSRMPTPKAHGIQIAKACEGLIEADHQVTLVMPRSRVWSSDSVSAYYHLRKEIPTKVLGTPDFYGSGELGFLVSTFCFAIAALFYLRKAGKGAVVYARPDPFFLPFAIMLGYPCYAEVHDAYIPGPLTRRMLARAKGIIVTNTVIRDAVARAHGIPLARFHIEANGVDLAPFESAPDKSAAHAKLDLAADAKIALYMGRLYDWKGLEVLPDAARAAPSIEWHVVGGSEEKFKKVTGVEDIPENLFIHEGCPSYEVPTWLAASDVLLSLGTKKNETSYRYTTPIKTYEYMAAKRPVVAATTLALKDVIGSELAYFYEPDDAQGLAGAVNSALSGGEEVMQMTERAYAVAQEHAWNKRAARIAAFIASTNPRRA